MSTKSLPMTKLGKTGKTLSRYGLGGFHQVEITSDIVASVIDTFLANGGNYIETARSYGGGASEVKIGQALEGRRDQVVLCSKTGARTADEARRELETSLKLLRTDHIEFYYFHGVNTDEELDTVAGPGGALEALLKAKEEGLIDGLGLSSHRLPMYLKAFERIPLDLILIWCNYLDCLNYPMILDEIFPAATAKGIGITAMKPLADGYLYRSVEDALRYTLGVGAEVAVCGTNSPAQVEQVADAVRRGPADAAMQAAILKRAIELGQYVCRQCGVCSKALMNLFQLEGVYDRQMLDYLEHDPAHYALSRRLANWFNATDLAQAQFAASGDDPEALLAQAEGIECPYGIDVPRKTRIVLGKLLADRSPNFV